MTSAYYSQWDDLDESEDEPEEYPTDWGYQSMDDEDEEEEEGERGGVDLMNDYNLSPSDFM